MDEKKFHVQGMTPIALIRRHAAQLQRDFDRFVPYYRDVRDYIAPERSRYLDGNTPYEINDGSRKDLKILNGAPGKAVSDAAAGLQSGKTPKAREWFTLSASAAFKRNVRVKSYNNKVQAILADAFSRSNLYNAFLDVYEELLTFETAAIAILPHPTKVFYFRTFTIGEYLFSCDARGEVDTFILKEYLSTAQMLDEYGYDALSDRVKEMIDRGDYTTMVRVNVAVLRHPERFNVKSRDYMPVAEIHYEDDASDFCDAKSFLATRYYREFPVCVVRWSTVANDTLGKGPSRLALGDIKQLQAEERDKLQGVRKLVNPPLQGSQNLDAIAINASPGGYTPVADPRDRVTPLYTVNPDLNGLQVLVQEVVARIKGYYFNDLFASLATRDMVAHDRMTATEVNERTWEKMLLLGPVLERIDYELLDPLISRCLRMLYDAGYFPDVPAEVFASGTKIVYNSILSQMQKAVGVRRNENLVSYVGSISPVCPSAPKMLNWYRLVQSYAEGIGADMDFLVDEKEYNAAMADEAKQMQLAREVEMSEKLANSGKVASEIDSENISRLAGEMAGMNGTI